MHPRADRAPEPDLAASGARRAVVLVDGEHYPPVIVGALEHLRTTGVDAVAAVFLGGTEKVANYGADVDLGIPVSWVPRQTGPGIAAEAAAGLLRTLLAEHDADLVFDLSDEPVLDPRRRLQLASHVLLAGVPYWGADFALTPPPRPRLSTRPTIAVIGTGKRTGKTAISGEIVRRLAADGSQSVVVAMGRGGPPEPVVVPAGTVLDAASLLRVAEAGGHAASDFYEDAVTTGRRPSERGAAAGACRVRWRTRTSPPPSHVRTSCRGTSRCWKDPVRRSLRPPRTPPFWWCRRTAIRSSSAAIWGPIGCCWPMWFSLRWPSLPGAHRSR